MVEIIEYLLKYLSWYSIMQDIALDSINTIMFSVDYSQLPLYDRYGEMANTLKIKGIISVVFGFAGCLYGIIKVQQKSIDSSKIGLYILAGVILGSSLVEVIFACLFASLVYFILNLTKIDEKLIKPVSLGFIPLFMALIVFSGYYYINGIFRIFGSLVLSGGCN